MQSAINTYLQEVQKITKTYGAIANPKEFSNNLASLEKHQDLADSFYHILDLRDFSIIAANGAERFLGISQDEFSFKTLVGKIHPAFQTLFLAKALAVNVVIDQYKAYSNSPTAPSFYNIFYPLQLSNGKYYRVRQMSTPFCADKNGNMIMLLNIYRTGLEPYAGQPMTSYFSLSNGALFSPITEMMKIAHKQSLHENIFTNYPSLNPMSKQNWGFSETQIALLKVFAKEPKLSWTQAAKLIHRAPSHTPDLWNKGIKPLANQLFMPKRFEKIQDFVTFFQQMDLLY